MKYIVEIVGDEELPEGMESVIVEREDEPPMILISGSAARCWRLMRSWEDTIEPEWQPSVTLPRVPLRLVPEPLRFVGYQALAQSSAG